MSGNDGADGSADVAPDLTSAASSTTRKIILVQQQGDVWAFVSVVIYAGKKASGETPTDLLDEIASQLASNDVPRLSRKGGGVIEEAILGDNMSKATSLSEEKAAYRERPQSKSSARRDKAEKVWSKQDLAALKRAVHEVRLEVS